MCFEVLFFDVEELFFPNVYDFPQYEMEIPQFFSTNKCKIVKTIDKTKIEYWIAAKRWKNIFLVLHPAITQICPQI